MDTIVLIILLYNKFGWGAGYIQTLEPIKLANNTITHNGRA